MTDADHHWFCDHQCLRKRIERRIRKRLRYLSYKDEEFVFTLHKYERSGMPLVDALRKIMLDSKAGWYDRGTAARVLALTDAHGTIARLLNLFFTQTNQTELWETALTIEYAGDRAAVQPLVNALYDTNFHRRHAAARALGWIWPVGRQAARALIRALLDKSQPQPVREEAAESLAYSNYPQAVGPLVSVLDEPDVRMRFWAVFALGGIGQWQTYKHRRAGRRERGADPRVIEALGAC
jgi:HEAT repeat protein